MSALIDIKISNDPMQAGVGGGDAFLHFKNLTGNLVLT